MSVYSSVVEQLAGNMQAFGSFSEQTLEELGLATEKEVIALKLTETPVQAFKKMADKVSFLGGDLNAACAVASPVTCFCFT